MPPIHATALQAWRLVEWTSRSVVATTFIVGAFVIAAVLTPPDVISQLALALPLMILYEGSIWAAKWVEPKAKPAADPSTDVTPAE